MKLVGCNSALTATPPYPSPPPPPPPHTHLFFSFIYLFFLLTVLRCLSDSLLICGLFYGAIFLIPAMCYFVLVLFSPFSIAITLFGEEKAHLSVFHTFVRFALVLICLFSLPVGVLLGLRLVIVALPGLFLLPF